jgi:hypothetical protein
MKDGQGTYKWKNGAFYIGEWKSDKRHGKGLMTGGDGFVEEGMFMNDVFIGKDKK